MYDPLAHILSELARRQPTEEVVEERKQTIADAAAGLRSIFGNHPKQRRLYRSAHKRKATRKTRRAGATAGGVRELLARSIEHKGHRATYVTTTRIEAKERAWKNDSASGFYDILAKYGTPVPNGGGVEVFDLGGVTVEVREAELALDFSNGSRIDLFGADNIRAIGKKRGNAKHVFWVDEAQDFRFLSQFYKAVVIGSLTDFDGECWLSGTPGRDCSGLFFEATRDDEERDDAWEVHEVAVVDNPYFGAVVWEAGKWFVVDNLGRQTGPYTDEAAADQAAERIRWANTAGKHIRENKLREDDPDVLREWFAKWVMEDLAYVYPVHLVPKSALVFAPQRLIDNPYVGTHPRFSSHPRWYDRDAALADLPRRGGRPYQWLFGVGADFGYFPDPFAIVLLAFCREMPDVFEMFSWKHTRVLTDDQGSYLNLAWSAHDTMISLVGDPAGKQDDFEVWRQRMGLPITEANKQGKNTLEEFLANAVRRGQVHYRENSPLLLEHKSLVYLPQKPGKPRMVDKYRRSADGLVHGDHCADACRYLYADIDHYLYRAPAEDSRPVDEKREQQYDDAIDQAHAAREALEQEYGEEGWDY